MRYGAITEDRAAGQMRDIFDVSRSHHSRVANCGILKDYGKNTILSTFNVSANVNAKAKRASFDARKLLILKVGAIGFEPTTSRSRTERSTRLSHAPIIAIDVHTNM